MNECWCPRCRLEFQLDLSSDTALGRKSVDVQCPQCYCVYLQGINPPGHFARMREQSKIMEENLAIITAREGAKQLSDSDPDPVFSIREYIRYLPGGCHYDG